MWTDLSLPTFYWVFVSLCNSPYNTSQNRIRKRDRQKDQNEKEQHPDEKSSVIEIFRERARRDSGEA